MIPKNCVLQCVLMAWAVVHLGVADTTALAQVSTERPLSAEVHIKLLSGNDRADFDRVAEFLSDSQWDQAIETLRRVMENHGDELIALESDKKSSRGFLRYVRVKHVCQMLLASTKTSAPEAFATYRRQIDPLAERWYQQGVSRRDETLLRRVVDEALNSKFGDDALLRLGEIALERGDYSTAREYWERISPRLRTPAKQHPSLPAVGGTPLWLALRNVDLKKSWAVIKPVLLETEGQPNWLAYPDTDLNLADIRARLVLVSILENSRQRAAVELELLTRLHPQAEGRLAGKKGKYVELLKQLLIESKKWPATKRPADWETFGGSTTRNARAGEGVDVRGPPIWQRELANLTAGNEHVGLGRQRIAEHSSGLLSYHPLVVGDVVLLNDLTSIKAFRLRDGKPAWPNENGDGVIYGKTHPKSETEKVYPSKRSHVGVPRFTMTHHGHKLFARMGSPLTGFQHGTPLKKEQGVLVALDLETQKLLFDPIQPDGPEWAFEGSPVCDGVGLYVAMRYTKPGQARANLHVACFDIQTGRQRWRRAICGADFVSQGKHDEITHNLLTLAEGMLYCNTNLGAVAALATRDGAIKWITRYPRATYPNYKSGETDRMFFRDLNPALFYRGLIISAPSDCDSLFALDAATGQLIWKTQPHLAGDAVHLLGVGNGNLIVSGDALYWIDVLTGKLQGQFPDVSAGGDGFARVDPAGYGRGLLVANRIYWPTREKIYVISQKTQKTGLVGKPLLLRSPIDLIEHKASSGNLIIAKGVLLIATAKKLIAMNKFGRRRTQPLKP